MNRSPRVLFGVAVISGTACPVLRRPRRAMVRGSLVACLVTVAALAPSSSASAEGSLRPGELVAMTSTGLVRIDPASQMMETITPWVGDVKRVKRVAVRDKNTVYVGATDVTNYQASGYSVWQVDVRDGAKLLLGSVPAESLWCWRGFCYGVDLAVDLDGHALLLAAPAGKVYRFDKDAPNQTPTVLTDALPLHRGIIGAAIAVDNDGAIYISKYDDFTPGMFRLADGSLEQLNATAGVIGLDFDRRTGDLMCLSAFFGLCQVELDNPDFPVTYLGPVPLVFDSPIAVASDDTYYTTQEFIYEVSGSPPTNATPLMTGVPYVAYDLDVVDFQCLNGRDDDGDGDIDLADLDCTDAEDDRESSYCSDGLDNDHDGQTDLADPDCGNDPRSDAEITACNDGVGNGDIDASILGQPVDSADIFDAECTSAWDDSEADAGCQGEAMSCPPVRPPACFDGWDNDGDGFFDLEDPNCGGIPTLRSELPACDDGIDNDQDGTIDFAGLGNVPADPDCDEFEGTGELPECANGKDDDLDGKVDLGDDGCENLDDDNERPNCSDGIDNDGDGFIDFAVGATGDPDCRHAEDPTEAPRQCSDGVDNDGDGFTDYTGDGSGDPECNGYEDNNEAPTPPSACSTASLVDTTTSWFVMLLLLAMARTGHRPRRAMVRGSLIACLVMVAALAPSSSASAEGSLRPGEIVGVLGANIARMDPETESVESIASISGATRTVAVKDRNTIYAGARGASGYNVWQIDTRNGAAALLGSVPISSFGCGWSGRSPCYAVDLGVASNGDALLFEAGTGKVYRFVQGAPAGSAPTLVTDALPPHGMSGATARATIVSDEVGTIYVAYLHGIFRISGAVVEQIGDQNQFASIQLDRSTGDLICLQLFFGLCRIDVDSGDYTPIALGDGWGQTSAYDWHSPIGIGPTGTFYLKELWINQLSGPDLTTITPLFVSSTPGVVSDFEVVATECLNGRDDDGDGDIDLADLDCTDAEDDRESSYCSDGQDNDYDGQVDLADADCANDPRSDDEVTQCNDGVGNGDIDAWILGQPVDSADIFDLECTSAWDDSEHDAGCQGAAMSCPPLRAPSCFDGWDNDGDGFVDLEDPHCGGIPSLRSELPACDDGIDNDQDGTVDFAGIGNLPGDDDCDEFEGTGELPECANGIDDDLDGRVDLGDAGCASLTDDAELSECADGIDNDGDGFTDYSENGSGDPDCNGYDDNREAPNPPKVCSTASLTDTTTSWLGVVLLLIVARARRRIGWRIVQSAVSIALAVALLAPSGAVAQASSGSGQFTGLSTAPEANLFSGSMSTSVPIAIPQGRKNATPQLQLSYSSGGGSGPFGYGWSLPLGTVERSTKNGRPQCTGDTIRDFVLSLSGGTMELDDHGPISNGSLKRKYMPRVDESYLVAEGDAHPIPGPGEVPNPDANTWTVYDRAGMTYRFGHTPESRAWHKYDRFVLEDAPIGLCEFTSIWALNEIVDSNGNNVLFTWFKDQNTLYPDEIVYGGNPLACLYDGECEHPFSVKFIRSTRASLGGSDIEQSHRGVQERIEHIITRIEVRYRTQAGAPYQLMRAYDLTYTEVNGRLLLTAVDDDPMVAFGGDLLPPQTFEYATHPIDHDESAVFSVPGGSLSDVGRRYSPRTGRSLLDMTGDGLVDLVDAPYSGSWTVHPGQPGGGFGTAISWSTSHAVQNGIRFSCWRTGEVSVRSHPYNDGNGCFQDDEGDVPSYTMHVNDTVDLTGDGIPDYVSCSDSNDNGLCDCSGGQCQWRVYPGYCNSATSCGFGSVQLWDAPSMYLGAEQKSSGDTWTTHKQLMDVSGDGRPDYILDGVVYTNTGSGFEYQPHAVWFDGPQTVDSKTIKQWMDFNGDGLPDLLIGSGSGSAITVKLNTGRALGTAIQLPTPTDANAITDSVRSGTVTKTHTAFLDVNSDGLPDRVYWLGHHTGLGLGTSGWAVQLNRGGTALDPQPWVWSTSLGPIRQSADWNKKGGVNLWHNTAGQIDVLDFNGDGFVDHVNATNGQVKLGKPNGPMAQPLALLTVRNGIGGVTNVAYQRTNPADHVTAESGRHYGMPFVNWVVDSISQTDGLSPAITRGFDYRNGLFHTGEREFRGFGTVTSTDSDGNETVTVYSQEDLTKGKALTVTQYVGAATADVPLMRETSVWHTQSTLYRDQVYLAEQRVEEFSLTSATDPWGQPLDRCVLNRNEPPDDHGRMTRTCSLACSQDQAGPADCGNAQIGQVTTDTVWSTPQSSSSMRERPLSVTTSHINAQGQSQTLAEKEFYYDGSDANGLVHTSPSGNVKEGNLRRVRTRFGAGPNDWTTVLNQYDRYGNILQVTDPEGHASTSTYSASSFKLYPVTETNALGHSVHTVTDLRYGKPTQKTGANGEVASVLYDGIGRPVCEAAPGETMVGCFADGPLTLSKQYRYHRGDSGASSFEGKLSYVEVRAREPDAPSGYLVSRQYTDGLGRQRVATTEQVVGAGPGLSTIVAEHIDYGSGGRVTDKFVPYVLSGAVVQQPGGASTTFDYGLNGGATVDPKGRVHKVSAPNGEETETYFEGRRTRVRSAQGTAHASEARSIEDHFGRVMRKETYEGNAGSPTVWFENAYDGMGRVLRETVAESVTDPNAPTLVTHTYDLLGREVALDDPDSGVWSFKYDKNGNVLSRNDPEPGQHVQWLYDALGRVKLVCTYTDDDNQNYRPSGFSCGSAGTLESSYLYDIGGNKGIGRLTAVNDRGGSEAFVYDERGRVTSQTRILGGGGTALSDSDSRSATTSFVYNEVDRVKVATYPGGQGVNYLYNQGGRLMSVLSNGNYVSAIHYDTLGRVEKLVHGNGVEDRREYYSASTENQRLKKISSSRGASDYLDLEYGYNDLGKVATVTDHRNASGVLSNTAAYTYDPLGRLTVADLSGADHDDTFTYSPIGNITQKGGVTMQYQGFSHQLTQYGSTSYDYNDNGERVFEDRPEGDRHYTYDALGRLTAISLETGESVEYVYDHAGRRVAKRVNPAGATGDWSRYFSKAAESEIDENGDGWLVKYYYAGDQRIAMKREQTNDFVDAASVAPVPFQMPDWFWVLLGLGATVLLLNPGQREVRLGVAVGPTRAMGTAVLALVVSGPALIGLTACHPPAPKPQIQHYHVDHLGSTQVVTSPTGTIERQVRYEPYGEVRGRYDGNGAALTSDQGTYRHEFTGYETELESGLQYAGARYFDPGTAQFLSHDPERQYASPYAYGPGDPMNGTDPDGREFITLAIAFAIGAIKAAAVGAAIGAAVSFGMALVQGASFRQALQAAGQGAIQGAISGALGFIAAPLEQARIAAVWAGEATFAETVRHAAGLAIEGYQGVQRLRAVMDGDPVAALGLAFDVIGAAQSFDASASTSGLILHMDEAKKNEVLEAADTAIDIKKKVTKGGEELIRIIEKTSSDPETSKGARDARKTLRKMRRGAGVLGAGVEAAKGNYSEAAVELTREIAKAAGRRAGLGPLVGGVLLGWDVSVILGNAYGRSEHAGRWATNAGKTYSIGGPGGAF